MTGNELKVRVDCNVYPLNAVKAAGYTFTGKAFVEIKEVGKTQVEVILKPKNNEGFSADKLKGEFLNELLHHALRLKIAQNNDEIRKFIVTKALAASSPFEGAAKSVQNLPADKCDCATEQKKPVKIKLDKEMAGSIKSIASEPDKDYKKDPAGIRIKWEEKNSDKLENCH